MARRWTETPTEVLNVAARGCPPGLLGKLACASKELRDACRAEAERLARDAGAEIPRNARGEVRLPPVSVGLFETSGEVEWALSCGLQPSERLATALAASGCVPALQRAVDAGAPLTEWACLAAAKHGKLEALKWARAKGAPWGNNAVTTACTLAADGGHLELLKWAIENGAEFDDDTCTCAAAGGHLEVLQWARANGAPWNEDLCSAAAEGGHLEVLKWARENGAPWNEDLCSAAAEGGHLEVLKWARANGAEWDEDVVRAAEDMGHLDVLEWALAHGAPR
jgi:hypothetical protein